MSITPKVEQYLSRASSLSEEDRARKLAVAIHKRKLNDERDRQADLGEPGRPGGLMDFIRYFWHVLEPSTPFVDGWAMQAIAVHLEAVTRGEIKRLLINVPPGFAKSLIVNVFWPAWEWAAAGKPHIRYVTFSYAAHLTERDNQRFLDVIQSKEFAELWGSKLTLETDGKIKPSNDAKGWKFSSSLKGVGTGERGDRSLHQDLHNVKEGESEKVREETVRWVKEGMSNRLNDMQDGVIIGIAQRVHEEDASAAMLGDSDYVHLMIPMEFDPSRKCRTMIGWEDPRTEFGELAPLCGIKLRVRLRQRVGDEALHPAEAFRVTDDAYPVDDLERRVGATALGHEAVGQRHLQVRRLYVYLAGQARPGGTRPGSTASPLPLLRHLPRLRRAGRAHRADARRHGRGRTRDLLAIGSCSQRIICLQCAR